MRLTAAETAALREALRGEAVARVFLFGSRTDDSRRGGDVDLLLFSTDAPLALAHRVSSRYARLMDGRLDVLVIDPTRQTPEQQAFLANIETVPLDGRF